MWTNDKTLRKLVYENSREVNLQKIGGVLWDEQNGTLIFDFEEILQIFESTIGNQNPILKKWAMLMDLINVPQFIVLIS